MAENPMLVSRQRTSFWNRFPWWFVATLVSLGAIIFLASDIPEYREAVNFIIKGLPLTLLIGGVSLVFALLIGLVVGFAGRSGNILLRNLAFFYLAVIGGIPTIILVFFIAFVAVPTVSGWLEVDSQQIQTTTRFVIALALVYGAVYGDALRIGLGDKGRRSGGQVTRFLLIVGIVFIALLKDTSLVAFLGAREITQQTRLFAGSTFQFNVTYGVAILLYIALTLPLRLLTTLVEERFSG